MNVDGEPKVIEYNCRMGDPETEVVLARLDTDLLSLFAAMDNGTLEDANINFNDDYFATVMAVSGGYPGDYEKGKVITFNHEALDKSTMVFHAGTKQTEEGVVTNGGRVLTVTASGDSIKAAVEKSKAVLANIHFEGINYRKDIGFEFG